MKAALKDLCIDKGWQTHPTWTSEKLTNITNLVILNSFWIILIATISSHSTEAYCISVCWDHSFRYYKPKKIRWSTIRIWPKPNDVDYLFDCSILVKSGFKSGNCGLWQQKKRVRTFWLTELMCLRCHLDYFDYMIGLRCFGELCWRFPAVSAAPHAVGGAYLTKNSGCDNFQHFILNTTTLWL